MSRIAQNTVAKTNSFDSFPRPTAPLPPAALEALARAVNAIGPRPARPARTRVVARPVPMPGRLAVSYHRWDLKMDVDTTLDQVPTGSDITTTGTITGVRYLDPSRTGRTMIVLTGADGHHAHVSITPDTARRLHLVLTPGTRLTVRGTAARALPSQPAGIDARTAWTVA